MSKQNKLSGRIIAVLLIASGLVLGVTWNNAKFCIGDSIFIALGLPAWSNGTTGTHYPAVVGTFVILIGVSVLNYTLQKKARLWLWTIVVLCIIALNMIISYM